MSRSLRSRKPLSEYSAAEFTLDARSKNKPSSKTRTSVEKTKAERDAAAAIESKVVEGSKTRSTKGNLLTGWKTVKAIRTAVLRDRTNIPEERLKVDVLMKQGRDGGDAKRAAKSATATRTSKENDDDDGKVPSIVSGTRKKSPRESAADGDSKDAEQATRDEIPKKPLKATRKTTKSAISEKAHDEIVKKASPVKTTRKKPRKAPAASESLSHESDESPKVESATGRTTSIVKKSSKITKRIVESTDPARNDEKSVEPSNSPKITRKRARKMEAERESSTDSRRDTKNIVENDNSEESETEERGATTTRKFGERGVSKRVSSAVKSADSRGTAKKSSQRASRVKFVENDAKIESNATVQKKFFKSKATIERSQRDSPIKKTVNGKRRNIGTRRNVRMSVSFRMRQPTLDESFAKQATRKILRRRDTKKNYCEDTIIAKKGVSKNDDNVGDGKKTVPVYKSVKLQDNSISDGNEVYEFKFDYDDSREKLPKNKRRKMVRKKAGTKKPKTVSVPKKATSSKTRAIGKITETQTGRGELERIDVVEPVSTDLNTPTVEEPAILPIIEEESSKRAADRGTKPKIVDSTELKGSDRINLMATPVLSKSSEVKPRNVLGAATSQYGTMLKHALLNKSISPITKAIESFDPGSPWRPPTFANQEFSRVKNIVQSTPQVRKFSTLLEKTGPTARNEAASKPVVKREPARKEDAARAQISDKRSPSKAIGQAKSPRKFGTVISNIDNSSTIVATNVESKENHSRENVVAKRTTYPPPIEPRVSIISDHAVSLDRMEPMNVDDENGDKENCLSPARNPQRSPLKPLNKAPFRSLDKSPLKNLSRSPLKSLNNSPLKGLDRSPLKSLNRSPMQNLNKSPIRILDRSPSKKPTKLITKVLPQKSSNDENAEPQAGPSSSRMSEARDDSRILRQSNLDNFLNIDEMPKSTRISTMHGIFDDPHSTPISGRKPVRKMDKDPDVDNAFGFDECDDTENDITPVERPVNDFHTAEKSPAKNQPEPLPKKHMPATARLSLGDIKKHLLPIGKKAKVEREPIIERIEEEEKENRDDENGRAAAVHTKIDDQIDATDDDLQPEKTDTNESTKRISLFADLEPVHFKQAPRYSYKRKRAVGFFLSDDEDEIESLATAESHRAKKRKVSKVEKEREKQLENWAKDLNQTFEEIDHFDLVVE